jgi:D-glycero-D-manno-heptose 1,7-bisphosphate phosphatase
MSPTGILLLDLDGTVRETISGETFINKPEDQKMIAGAAKAMQHYPADEWRAYGITNQAGVLYGYKSLENMADEQIQTMIICPWLHSIYACPDKGEQCFRFEGERRITALWGHEDYRHLAGAFRKPAPGMLMAAIIQHRKEGGLVSKILMAGDRPEDKAAAEAAGVPFLSAEDWWAGKCPEP